MTKNITCPNCGTTLGYAHDYQGELNLMIQRLVVEGAQEIKPSEWERAGVDAAKEWARAALNSRDRGDEIDDTAD